MFNIVYVNSTQRNMENVKNVDKEQLRIYICNPMRTGSTYLYNFIRECTPNQVYKYEQADYVPNKDFDRVIVPMRHPVAVLSSLADYFHKEHNETEIRDVYVRLLMEFSWAYQYLEQYPDIAYRFEYDYFINNPLYLKERLTYDVGITVGDTEQFTNKYTIENVKRMVETQEDKNINLFQENHISPLEGDSLKRIKRVRGLGLMYNELVEISKKYGYEY